MDDVLNEKVVEEVVEAPEAPPVKAERQESLREQHQQREYEAQGRGPDGKFLPKDEPKEEKPKEEVKAEPKAEVKPPPQEMTEKERGFLRGLEEERRKRQDLERQIAELRNQKPAEKAEEKKTFWDDPEGHFKTFEQRIAQRESALAMNVSERLARSKYQDFDANIEVFAEILRTPAGPGIHQQFINAPDPAEFAYRLGKHTKEVRDAGSIDDLRAKIEKETRAKVEAEFKQKQEELEKKREAIPPSLSDVRGGGAKAAVAWAGPPSLDDILKK
jgi:hypothetical protein